MRKAMTEFTLELLPTTLAICRLDPEAQIPDWATGTFVSITRRAVYQDILKIHARVLATLGIETHRPRGVNLFSPTIFP
jgi:hypothetical protein